MPPTAPTATQQPRVFTLEAVNALVPKLNLLVGEQLHRRTGIESRLKALSDLLGDLPNTLTFEPGDTAEVRELKRELVERVDEYQGAWREVEDMGAVVKDPRIGLLDFYGRVEGRLVWLCWKYGELEVAHYHGLDEGYAGRKAIHSGIKQRLLN